VRVYTVHCQFASPDFDRGVRLVKEGFCWPAFLVAPLWALWHRLWLVVFLVLLVGMAIDVALDFAGADTLSSWAVLLAYSVLIGSGASDWHRAALDRRGFREVGLVAARDEDAAVRRFFDLHPELAPGARRPDPFGNPVVTP
jgi:hypothetical protein